MKLVSKQPNYFNYFRCVAEKCTESCCDGWKIYWNQDEYEKLYSSNASPDLKDRIKNTFVFSDGKYDIVMHTTERTDEGNKDNHFDLICPFHNRNTGLCDIQKELGEEYLGEICRRFPRKYIYKDNYILRTCSTACPTVVDFHLENSGVTKIDTVNADLTINGSVCCVGDSVQKKMAYIQIFLGNI